ncbi:MAG TPA: AraC family transcriptional regulator [Pseudomonas sp.]|nr:AraC family transcriptional regulator [Pseudomonas sp.]
MTFPWSVGLMNLARSSVGLAGSYLDSLLPAAEALGLDVDELLRQAGLTREQLTAVDHRLPLFKAIDLLLHAERQSADPLIGLRLGLAVRPRSFQILGYASMSSATLGQAILRLQRFESLVWDIGNTQLREEGEWAVLSWQARRLPWLPRQAVEVALSGWVALGRRLSGGHAEPARIEFRHRLADDPRRYVQLFGCPVRGGAIQNAVIFPKTLLALPLPEADPTLCLWMDRQGEAYLGDTSLKAHEVRAALCQGLPLGEFELEPIAARLGLSGRQLKRRLADAGLTLAGLQDEVRRDLALLYLQHSGLSLLDVAYLLGFSEQSSFSRAFRRWHGCAPSVYRKPAVALTGAGI